MRRIWKFSPTNWFFSVSFHIIRWLTCNLFGLINGRRRAWRWDHSLRYSFFIGLEIAVNVPVNCEERKGATGSDQIFITRIYEGLREGIKTISNGSLKMSFSIHVTRLPTILQKNQNFILEIIFEWNQDNHKNHQYKYPCGFCASFDMNLFISSPEGDYIWYCFWFVRFISNRNSNRMKSAQKTFNDLVSELEYFKTEKKPWNHSCDSNDLFKIVAKNHYFGFLLLLVLLVRYMK